MDTRTDSLGRQFRWTGRNPLGKYITITDRDLNIFETIERHGLATSKYLHHFVGGDVNTFTKRLQRLYHWGYLDRFQDQEFSFPNRIRHIIYGNTNKARGELAKVGKSSSFVDRTDPFHHRFMGACVSASIERECVKHGLRYMSRNEILSKKNNPLKVPLLGKAHLEPDDLFGIEYQDESKRRFVVEIDRGNEPIRGTNRHSSLEKKLDYYEHFISNRLYFEHWGVPGIMVLFVTTSEGHLQNFFDLVNKRDQPDVTSRIVGKVYRAFGTNSSDWLVPADLLEGTLIWRRPDGTTFDLTS